MKLWSLNVLITILQILTEKLLLLTQESKTVFHENVIRTRIEDHEMILNRLVQEADALTILNETSGVKNVSSTKLTKIRL